MHPKVLEYIEKNELFGSNSRKREILKLDIKELEELSDKTPQQEQELQNKRAELARLEAEINAEKQKTNWTPWIGLGIIFVIVISLSAYLLVKKKIINPEKME